MTSEKKCGVLHHNVIIIIFILNEMQLSIPPSGVIHLPRAWFPLSVLPRTSLCSTDALPTARGVSGASVLAACRPRLSPTCFMIATIRLKPRCASPAAPTVGALWAQCSVRAHSSSSSPIITGLRGALIAPV